MSILAAAGAEMPHPPNLIELLEMAGVHLPKGFPHLFLYALIVMALLVIPSWAMTRRVTIVPSRGQAFLEVVVEGLEKFFAGLMGPIAREFTPFLGTLFIYILVMNLLGLVPLFESPTVSLGTNLGLAVVVFFMVQAQAIKHHGLIGYLKELRGDPWWMGVLMFPLHVMGEIIRPISLSLRLFGNILSKEILIFSLIALSPIVFGFIPIPFHAPILFLGVLFSVIQALIFTSLSAIYIAGAVYGHGGGEAHH